MPVFTTSRNAQIPTRYPRNGGLDLAFKGVDAPTLISQINKVERQGDLAINGFRWHKEVIVRLSKQPMHTPRINMQPIKMACKLHYTSNKDLIREHTHLCEHLLYGYTREDLLEAHKPECHGIGKMAVRVEMLEKGKNKPTLQNNHKQLPAPSSFMPTLRP